MKRDDMTHSLHLVREEFQKFRMPQLFTLKFVNKFGKMVHLRWARHVVIMNSSPLINADVGRLVVVSGASVNVGGH